MPDSADPNIKRTRVLLSAFACEPGRGSEQEVGWRWALEMSKFFDVTVLTQTRNQPGIEKRLQEGIPNHCRLKFEYFQFPGLIYRLKSRFDILTWPYYALWQVAIIRTARRMHQQEPFGLVHHVTFVSFRVPVWIKRLKQPVVFGPVGGADIAPFQLLKRGFTFRIRIKEILRNLLTHLGAITQRVLPPLSNNNGLCLAATPSMGRIFESSRLPFELFPAIGIDVGEPPLPRTPGPLRFLFVGRFHPLKGTHLLLEAFSRANIPKCTLTLVGTGQDETRLKTQAEELGISKRLTWTGKLPRKDLLEFYCDHDVLVVPSLYESGGLVALEAMAQGTPVIALDVGGHSVSITDGCGILISPKLSIDKIIDKLASAMTHYAAHTAQIHEDGLRAQKRISEHYTWEGKATHMRKIYERLLTNSKH